MSSMLEQAIVDAAALREAALKNAEQSVIEKYAPEIKAAVESLLEDDSQIVQEQEEAIATSAPPMSAVEAPFAVGGQNPDDHVEMEIEFEFNPEDFVRIESGASPWLTKISDPGKYLGVLDEFVIDKFKGILIPHDFGNNLCS